ncbi:hypothetical protein DL93DRAFT_743695 [Clavulina sp. PMI_390]|nr:hypothetical protein DL93DRAFT_743695 [Clavulina sp. PMI_390]
MLPKGAACFECRRLKVKCDGLVPLCSRCKFLCKKCDYTPANARPLSTTRALEARALELEMTIHKLTLPSTHDLSLVSTRLLERIARLGNLPPPKRLTGAADSTLILKAPHYEGSEAERRYGKVLVEGITKRELSAVQRAVEYELRSYNWRELEEMDELPLTLSIHLINLFLPSRSLYYFLVDISHFIYRVSLPSSHPEAIHPCLLNACYLAACSRDDGGGLTAFKDYFLERTRRFLQQSLMFADRIPDFLWASVVLSVFFVKERRLVESVSTASATARFALACGLSLPGDSAIAADGEASTIDGLLPPPRDAVEADDRVRLAHAIYLGVQAFPQLCGYPPTFPYEDWWSPISREALLKFQDGKVRSISHVVSHLNNELL